MSELIEIDGAEGEGGGQVVRTSLALSVATGRPVRVRNVRARRGRPGLLRQHLTALEAAAEVSGARVEGASLGSRCVALYPSGRVAHGSYRFSVGTAGSAPLVLHTVVPGLLAHPGESQIVVEGGTDNPAAPPSRFLTEVWAPRVRQLGVQLDVEVPRRGFFPAGGGRLEVSLRVPERLEAFEIHARGALREARAIATLSRLPARVGERELDELARALDGALPPTVARLEEIPDPRGPGNVLSLALHADSGVEVFSAFGAKGKPAEAVAREVAAEATRWLASGAPVGEHQADQLVLLLALAGGGSFTTVRPSLHTRTQLALIPRFLDVELTLDEDPVEDRARVTVRPRG